MFAGRVHLLALQGLRVERLSIDERTKAEKVHHLWQKMLYLPRFEREIGERR
jgi:hypothetical protein